MKPLILTPAEVKAIGEGRKTQFRRVIKPQPVQQSAGLWSFKSFVNQRGGTLRASLIEYAPYAIGDRLYVRETWQALHEFNHLAPRDIPEHGRKNVNYIADGNKWDAKVRSPLVMPSWASRFKLEVTEVKVERLQEISEADAIAEGVYIANAGTPFACYWDYLENESRSPNYFDATDSFWSLWESIHGPGSWAKNEWVFAYTFRRVEK